METVDVTTVCFDSVVNWVPLGSDSKVVLSVTVGGTTAGFDGGVCSANHLFAGIGGGEIGGLSGSD